MFYKVKDCFMMKEVAEDFIVFPRGEEAIQSPEVLVFNETGAFVWKLLENGDTAEEMAEKLAEKYGITKEQANGDITDLLKKMEESNLLEKTNG